MMEKKMSWNGSARSKAFGMQRKRCAALIKTAELSEECVLCSCRLQKMKNHLIRFVRMSKMLRRLQTVNVERWRVNKRKVSKFVLPTYTEENNVHRQTGRMMPISSFVGGFPFASSGFNDHSGFYRGHDGLGGTVYLNSWYRGRDRTNSNYVIAGNAGMGKSATIKAMAIMERALGASIFLLIRKVSKD